MRWWRTVQGRVRQLGADGRFLVTPAIAAALVPYVVLMLAVLIPADRRIWMVPEDWVTVVTKLILGVGTPVGLFLMWRHTRPTRRILRVYDWLGGGVLATSVLWLGSLGRDLMATAYLGETAKYITTVSTALWGILGSGLIIAGTAHLSGELKAERQERQRLEALMDFTRRITGLDYRAIQYEAVQHLHRLLQSDATMLFLWDDESQVLIPTAEVHNRSIYSSEYIERMMSFRCPLGYGLTGWVMQTGEPVITGNVSTDPRSQPLPGYAREEKSSLLAPIQVEGRRLGVVRLTRRGLDQFANDDLNLVLSFANQAALVIEHGRIIKELSELSITDPLTGLYNARHFHQVLDTEVRRAQRYDQPLSLVMTDSDSLKMVNDLLGHQRGDDHLKNIGHALRSAVRLTDYAFRYAGDEFLLLLPNTGPDEALIVGERIRQMMENQEAAKGLKTTVSVGVATLPMHAKDGEGLLAASDWAMYQSKRAGKNRITLVPDDWAQKR